MKQNLTTIFRSAALPVASQIVVALTLPSCSSTPELASVSQQSSVERETLRATAFLPHLGRFGLRDSLPAHEPLVLVKKGWGYSMVRTVEGRMGEVPSEDIGPRTDLSRTRSRVSEEWIPASAPRPVEKDSPAAKLTPSDPTPEDSESPLEDLSDLPPVEPELPDWGSSADEI